MLHQITETVGPWINEGIEAHGQGENICWEPTLMPNPQGGAVYTVIMWFPGALLGTTVQGSFQLGDPLHVNQTETVEIVRAFLEQVRSARSAQVAPQEGPGAPPAPVRGTQTPSGLLIP